MTAAIHIPAGTTIRYEALSFSTTADAEMTVHVIEECNGFTKALDADGDILYVRTKALPGRDSSLYPHPDAPCWGCKTIADADKKLEAIKDHHYHTPTRYRDHHALAAAELRHANTVARLNDKTQLNQPACTATEDEVSIDDTGTDADDSAWTTDPAEIGRTLGIPAPVILPAPPAPAPTKRSTQPTDVAVAQLPARTSKAEVPSVDPISNTRLVYDEEGAPGVIIPSDSGRGEYRVRVAWGMDDHFEPVSCTCKHYTCRIAPKVRRSLRYGAEEVFEECKHMRRVRLAILHGHLDGVTPYRLVALAA